MDRGELFSCQNSLPRLIARVQKEAPVCAGITPLFLPSSSSYRVGEEQRREGKLVLATVSVRSVEKHCWRCLGSLGAETWNKLVVAMRERASSEAEAGVALVVA